MAFHVRCGERVTLSNNNCTALRNISEFNHGLVISAEPLKDDVLFEVRIDRKINSWSGSIEIGVTAANPETLDFPACATKLRNGSWIMSGVSVLKDGSFVVEFYGKDLEKLLEGDRVGVMRSSQSELIFYINGESQGPAAYNIPQGVYAVIDLYGKCVQVSITKGTNSQPEHNNDSSVYLSPPLTVTNTVCPTTIISTDPNDRLRFHKRCGSMIRLSASSRTAERRRPLDEFNNGVVMTHRALLDNELFEIRIDRLIDKWSGSIEVGVTTHNPEALQFPATMTNMRSGTIMMSGSGILTNGKGTRREYGEFNLDELRVGDRVGMIRHSNGNLHYYINGLDQGVAAVRVAPQLWGVIDLYGMTIRVTIVDRDEREQQNLVTRRCMLNSATSISEFGNSVIDTWSANDSDRLLFHPICGTHAEVINNGRTIHRPNATDDFNNGVVLTQRPLRLNEIFEVRLEKIITKWAGSIEIGVTTHAPSELEFPFTMTNVRTGTWMMTGNGIMHNGITVIETYGQNLDRLQVGDRVGVIKREGGVLHFCVNGVDQGPAASDIPDAVYGVVDLYGQAYQASIVDTSDLCSPDTMNSSVSNITLYSDLRFHAVHGRNALILSNGVSACRPRAHAEFNDAIVFSNRPLRDGEMFEITLDTLVERWCGSVEIGLTAVRPEDISLPTTATDLEQDTVMLSGAIIMENGCNVRSGYPLDLDSLRAGSKIGVTRNASNFVHFYLDGVDQGPACEIRGGNLYAVVDLYGMCTQISIVQNEARAPYAISENSASLQATSVIQPNLQADVYHRFANTCGRNVNLSESGTFARRKEMVLGLHHTLAFSGIPLAYNEPFEVKIVSHTAHIAGSIKIGITDLNINNESVKNNVPGLIKNIPSNTWYASGNDLHYNNTVIGHFTPSLHWLRTGDRVALELTSTRSLKVLINSDEVGVLFYNVPEMVWVVVELSGSVSGVQVTSVQGPRSPLRPCALRLQDSLDFALDHVNKHDSMLESLEVDNPNFEFSDYFGKNIKLNSCKKIARRIKSYNNGIVFTNKPLIRGQQIMVRIDSMKDNWRGSIVVGVVGMTWDQIKNTSLPSTAFAWKGPAWVVACDYLCVQGTKIKSKYGASLSNIKVGTVITLSLSSSGSFSVSVGNTDLGVMATDLPQQVFPLIDVYGPCEKVSIVTSNSERLDQSIEIDDIDAFSSSRQNNVVDEIITENLITLEPSTSLQEKADLELHEKESNSMADYVPEIDPIPSTSNNGLNDPYNLNDNVSQNFLKNLEIQNATKPCMSTSDNENINIEIQRMENSYSEYLDAGNPVYIQNHVDNLNIQSRTSMEDISEYIQDNLLLQHNTNINIQRSQSSHSIPTNENNKTPNNSSVTINLTPNSLQPPDSLNITSAYSNSDLSNIENNMQSLTLSEVNVPDITLNSDQVEECSPVVDRDCDYLCRVINFKHSLVLPEAFFTSEEPKCYCSSCDSNSSRYTGWVRFKLKPKSTSCGDWRLGYYETRVDKIRAVLDLGQPLPMTSDVQVFSEKDNATGNKLILRENLEVRPQNTHSYTNYNEVYSISTAFEVRVRPGSISSCSSSEHDWVTKEAGACTLEALLMKVVIS